MLGVVALIWDKFQPLPILDRGIRLDLRLLASDAHTIPCLILS
jgi:hypothetical protein